MSLKVIFLVKKQKKNRKELYKKECVYNSLKEKDSLTNKQKIVLENINTYIKKLNNDLKNYKNFKIILHMG